MADMAVRLVGEVNMHQVDTERGQNVRGNFTLKYEKS